MKRTFAAVTLIAATATPALSLGRAVPESFASRGTDRAAIQTLLETYTRAVSTKNEALFETLLLGRDIPFSGVPVEVSHVGGTIETRNYESFRQGVFHGPPFTQRFNNVHIRQDGELASVTLTFVNSAPHERSWGWKTLQLLKTGGRWKIASEFYTGHDA